MRIDTIFEVFGWLVWVWGIETPKTPWNTLHSQSKCVGSSTQTFPGLSCFDATEWNKRQRYEWQAVDAIKLTYFQVGLTQLLRLEIYVGEGYSDCKSPQLWWLTLLVKGWQWCENKNTGLHPGRIWQLEFCQYYGFILVMKAHEGATLQSTSDEFGACLH